MLSVVAQGLECEPMLAQGLILDADSACHDRRELRRRPLAAEAVGLLPKGSSWARASRIVEPDVAARELYDERYALYRRLYPDTSEVQHALAEAQIREGDSC